MGTILQFALREASEPRATKQSGPAEIVIFPGVRIERIQDDAAPDLLVGLGTREKRSLKRD